MTELIYGGGKPIFDDYVREFTSRTQRPFVLDADEPSALPAGSPTLIG